MGIAFAMDETADVSTAASYLRSNLPDRIPRGVATSVSEAKDKPVLEIMIKEGIALLRKEK